MTILTTTTSSSPLEDNGDIDVDKNKHSHSANTTITPLLSKENLHISGVILGSIVSSVGIILLNKVLMVTYDFQFVMLLTSFHFLMCKIVFYAMSHIDAVKTFTPFRDISSREVWIIAVLSVGGVVLMNVSLQLNSVGLYQLLKLLTIPFIVAVQMFWYKKVFSRNVRICLVIMLTGVGIATVTDVDVTISGTIVGIAAVMATSLGQIQINDRKNHYDMSSLQFLEVVMGQQFIVGLAASIVFEFIIPLYSSTASSVSPFAKLMTHLTDFNLILMIVISGSVAITTNIFGISLIGSTSPVTFQVVGHGKTILIFAFGLILFPSSKSRSEILSNVIGFSIAMCALVFYGYFTRSGSGSGSGSSSKETPSVDKEKQQED